MTYSFQQQEEEDTYIKGQQKFKIAEKQEDQLWEKCN